MKGIFNIESCKQAVFLAPTIPLLSRDCLLDFTATWLVASSVDLPFLKSHWLSPTWYRAAASIRSKIHCSKIFLEVSSMHNELYDERSSGGLLFLGKSTSLCRFYRSGKIHSARQVLHISRNIMGAAFIAGFMLRWVCYPSPVPCCSRFCCLLEVAPYGWSEGCPCHIAQSSRWRAPVSGTVCSRSFQVARGMWVAAVIGSIWFSPRIFVNYLQ